jgi:outer membrane murein-binding lipoprotein Lpp
MFGESDSVDNLSCDLFRARNKRDALASDIITLTAEIAVLEASLLTENDRRERERAAESEARRKANDEECIRVFKAAGYKVVEPRFNVLTYKKWLEKGRRVKKGEKGFSVGPFKLFHENQTEVNGSSDLPLPIERVIPPQPKDNDPVLRLREWLRRNSRAKKETKHLKISAAQQRRRCIVRESVAGER